MFTNRLFFKGVLIFTAINFSITSVNAQSNSTAFQDSLIKDFCIEFERSSSTINPENLSVELGMLILPLFTKYKEQIKSEWGLDITDQADVGKAGEKVGQLAVVNCPTFKDYVKNNLNTILEERSGSSTKQYTGKILRIEGAPFTYLLVKNKAGRTEKIYWMDYFEGADNLSMRANSFLNKETQIEYKEVKVYDSLTKEYRTIKIITKIL